jgi:short-subunit dehydrogenase involved in D-alanine esterification of teichoic acids
MVKSLFKFIKKKEKPQKVSKMLLDVASEYIAIGENIDEKQQYLNGAVSAWNIACLRNEDRKEALKKYRKQYRRMNPYHTKADIKDALEDIRQLIERKDELYPDVNIQIAHAAIEIINNHNHVTVAFVKSRSR